MNILKTSFIMALTTISMYTYAQSQNNSAKSNATQIAKNNNSTTKSAKKVTNTTTTTYKTVCTKRLSTPKSAKTDKYKDINTGKQQIKRGLKEFGKGIGKIAKSEWKDASKAGKEIKKGGKMFFKKLGKSISDSFKEDSIKTK